MLDHAATALLTEADCLECAARVLLGRAAWLRKQAAEALGTVCVARVPETVAATGHQVHEAVPEGATCGLGAGPGCG